MVPRIRALLLEFSLLALRTDKDSRRTRGLKSACLTGAFSANQRKWMAALSSWCSVSVAREVVGPYRGAAILPTT